METPCLCPSEGHKYGCRKVIETSVTEFCYCSLQNRRISGTSAIQERALSASTSAEREA